MAYRASCSRQYTGYPYSDFPTGTVEGDVVFFAFSVPTYNDADFYDQSKWNIAINILHTNFSSAPAIARLYAWKRMTASDISTGYLRNDYMGSVAHISGAITFSGRHSSDVTGVNGSYVSGSSVLSMPVPDIAKVYMDDLVWLNLPAILNGGTITSFGPPSGFTEVVEEIDNASYDPYGAHIAYAANVSQGQTSSLTGTLTFSSGTGYGLPFIARIPATGDAVITGTLQGAVEADVVAGGKTVILTLTGDTWVVT